MVTAEVATREPAPTAVAVPVRRGGRDTRRLLRLRPGWPLFALFGGFPIWWVLGIGEFAPLIFSIPMAMHLMRQRRIQTPPGFGVWLLFVVWVLGGVAVLQVHAPGTIDSDSLTRYLTFGYRLLWYIAATIVLLYVGNTRKQISNQRVCLALSYMFVVVTAGGVLGLLAPHLQFRSGLEYVLPHSITAGGFVHGLIHPVAAQVQDFLGYAEARPSAPFGFTNEWGLALACFLPFFLISWCRRDAGWRRFAAPVILLLATVATVYSLNRGLWLALTVTAVFVAVRYALMGKVKPLALLGFAIVLAAAVIAVSPLGHLLLDRLAHPHSNQGRTNLGTLTVQSAWQGSPVMGFGSTRNVQGNFSSIAAAASSQCPGCSPPPLGTQGQLWLVVFSQGFVGLALYLGFFISQFVRHLRLTSPYVIIGLSVLLVQFVTMFVYDGIGPTFFAIMIAVGMLWRCMADHDEAPVRGRRRIRRRPRGALLAAYSGLVKRHIVALTLFALVGGLAGAAYQETHGGTESIASQSILIPPEQAQSALSGPSLTIDTDAKLITAGPVLDAVATAIHSPLSQSELATRFQVTASPNTNILNVAFTANNPADARRGIEAATTAYFALRRNLNHSVLLFDPGRIVRSTSLSKLHDGWLVSAGSGLMCGLALGLAFWWLLGDSWSRVRRRRTATSLTQLPVLSMVNAKHGLGDGQLTGTQAELARQPPLASVLATPGSAYARTLARKLDEALPTPRPVGKQHAVIVASTRSRAGEVNRLHREIDSAGLDVVGIVLVKG